MSFGVHVEGGTGAGSKRPLLPANTLPWACHCEVPDDHPQAIYQNRSLAQPRVKLNPGYLVRCIDCDTPRDARS